METKLTEQLKKEIDTLCATEGISKTDFIEDAIKQHLKYYQDKNFYNIPSHLHF